MPYNIYTIQITPDNVESIVDAALTQGWTLDHLQDNLEFYKAEDGFKALVLYITVIKATGRIMNCNDVPFYTDEHEIMDHIDVKDLLHLITKK